MKSIEQRYWEDVNIGDEVPAVEFPLSVARLVMAAGANRDFNSIHHNSEYAKETGASEMYANVIFLHGMWERAIREYIGLSGAIKNLKGFRMKAFNTVGETIVTKGIVKKKWLDSGESFVELEIWSGNSDNVTVGPGQVITTLPTRNH